MATSAELKQNILNGGYDQAFAKLYGADTATVAAQRVRYVDPHRAARRLAATIPTITTAW